MALRGKRTTMRPRLPGAEACTQTTTGQSEMRGGGHTTVLPKHLLPLTQILVSTYTPLVAVKTASM